MGGEARGMVDASSTAGGRSRFSFQFFAACAAAISSSACSDVCGCTGASSAPPTAPSNPSSSFSMSIPLSPPRDCISFIHTEIGCAFSTPRLVRTPPVNSASGKRGRAPEWRGGRISPGDADELLASDAAGTVAAPPAASLSFIFCSSACVCCSELPYPNGQVMATH